MSANPAEPIRTQRLELVAPSVEMLEAAISGRDELARLLGADVPASWPPDLLDEAALRFCADRLRDRPEESEWWLRFVILAGAPRTLIGIAGYKGPPRSGTVEVGYGIVRDRQRRGYATEATEALVVHAFEDPEVVRVIAETLPGLLPSLGVLRKCGFTPAEASSEPGVIRFERRR